MESYTDCLSSGGVYQGIGTDCTTVICDCDEGGKPALLLGFQSVNGFKVGEDVVVSISLDGACTEPVAGWQAFLEYDANALTFNSASYSSDPFGQAIIGENSVLLHPAEGVLNLAAGIDQTIPQNPVNGSYLLATLNFTAVDAVCIPSVGFRDLGDNPPKIPSRVTNKGGAEIESNLVGLPMPQCTGDVNGDGQVNVTDLIMVINAWGTDDCVTNIDGLCEDAPIGCVNVLDLILVLTNWGPCPE